jgi:hypothetical protein
VTSGHWNKYPNPFNPAVEATDILSREISPEGVLNTTRLMSTRFNFPQWVRRVRGRANALAKKHDRERLTSLTKPSRRFSLLTQWFFSGLDVIFPLNTFARVAWRALPWRWPVSSLVEKSDERAFFSDVAFAFPSIASHTQLLSVDRVHAVEHSQVDPVGRELCIRSQNINFSSTVIIEERIVYREHPDDPSK